MLDLTLDRPDGTPIRFGDLIDKASVVVLVRYFG